MRKPGWLSLLAAVALCAQAPHEPVGDAELGQRLFESQCAVCHGQGGTGGRGPALTRPVLLKAPDDGALRKAITSGLPPEMPGAWQLSEREVASVAAYVRTLGSVTPEKLPGDRARGKAVYRSRGCGGCHIAAGEGIGRGPELTAIGAKRNAAHLRESLERPNAYLPDGFLIVEAVPAVAERVLGARVAEDPFTIQIADASGAFHSFRKADLQELRRTPGQSTMPSFAGTLTAAELDDLVAYLAGLRGGL